MKHQEKDEFLRKRAERQRKIRKRRLIVSFCFFIVLLIFIGIVLCLTVFFPIKNLVINGSKIYTTKELIKASTVKIGDNLFTASAGEIEASLKNKLPFVDSIKLERKLPDTLKITVKDDYEFACYNSEDKYYMVSEKDWVLSETDAPHDTVFTVFGAKVKCEVGNQIEFESQEQKEILETIINASNSNNVVINEIDISDELKISLKVDGRFNVNLGTSNNIEEKIRHLSGMVANIEKEKFGDINLSMWSETKPEGTFVAGKED